MLGDRDWDPQVQMHVAFKETSPIEDAIVLLARGHC